MSSPSSPSTPEGSHALPAQGLTEQDIAQYLARTPSFFERHAELLATVPARLHALSNGELLGVRAFKQGLAPVVVGLMVSVGVILATAGFLVLTLPGLTAAAIGTAANGLVIVANGGWMPLDPAAAAAIGESAAAVGYSNSRVLDDPLLAPLIDRIAIAAPGPLAAVVSVGDLLIAAGLLVAIVRGMRGTDARREG